MFKLTYKWKSDQMKTFFSYNNTRKLPLNSLSAWAQRKQLIWSKCFSYLEKKAILRQRKYINSMVWPYVVWRSENIILTFPLKEIHSYRKPKGKEVGRVLGNAYFLWTYRLRLVLVYWVRWHFVIWRNIFKKLRTS